MSVHRAIRAAVALSVTALAPVAAQTPPTPSRAELVSQIDSLANDFLKSAPAPSVAVAVVKGSDTIFMKAFGLANIDAKRPATATTIYEIGSLTKQFTAAGIMKLVEAGKVSLDDEITKYVPSLSTHGQRVTIRHLLTHTSGVHSYTSTPAWRSTWASDLTPDSIVGFVKRDTLDFAPGARSSYSNTGYVLLGMVIEKISGKPYATFVKDEFFTPLKLTQTSYCPSRTTDPRFASGYSRKSNQIVPAEYLSLTHPHAAGALCSTVKDFVAWQRALAGGKVVTTASYTQMTTPSTLNDGRATNYGFGLSSVMLSGHRNITHTGGINGFTTVAHYFPDDTLSIVVFDNTDHVSPGPLATNIARVFYGLPTVARPQPPAPQPLAAQRRDMFVGTYLLTVARRDSIVFDIKAQGEGLVAEVTGQGTIPLVYIGNDTFGVASEPSIRLTFIVEGDRATRLRFTQGGQTSEGPRRP
jgi:CubicO group peptidase (beta-lactamase class C family)